MRRREWLGWVVALVLLASPLTSAQGWPMTVWFQQTIAIQAQRLAEVKAAQSDPPVRGYIDLYWTERNPTTWETELRLQGWMFRCGAQLHAIDLHLNGFVRTIAPSEMTTYPRGDVVANPGITAWCPSGIPVYSGFDIRVPLGILPSWYNVRLKGWTDDGQHYETNAVWLWID